MEEIEEDGVCDCPTQFAKKYPTYKGLVWMTVVKREDQPQSGGWRWRKWGTYIGEYPNEIEYLYDCDGKYDRPLIDEQWIYHLQKPDQNVLSLPHYEAYEFDGKGDYKQTGQYVQDSYFVKQLKKEMAFLRIDECIVCHESTSLSYCEICHIDICDKCNIEERHTGTFKCTLCKLKVCMTYYHKDDQCQKCVIQDGRTALNNFKPGFGDRSINKLLNASNEDIHSADLSIREEIVFAISEEMGKKSK